MAKPPAKSRDGKPDTPDTGELPTLERVIERELADFVPEQGRAEIAARITTFVQSEFFAGPIAHPRHLREYEDIQPGSADRIITMAEKRNDHIIASEQKVLDDEIADRTRGMRFGAILFGGLIVSAFISALLDKGALIVGLFLGTSAIGAIGFFIKGRNTR